MKKLLIIGCLAVLTLSGCTTTTEPVKTSPSILQTSPSMTQSKPTATPSATIKTFAISKEDIAAAKSAAEDYYKKTTMKVKSIEYDSTLVDRIPNDVLNEYGGKNIITFKVTLSDSSDPARMIFMGKKDGKFYVAAEGY